MSKIIELYRHAELISVEKISDKNYRDWRWRECFLYLEGQLYILESKDIRKGERFIYFNLRDGYLRTNFGTYIIEDNIITMTTKNSIYKFKIHCK